MPGNQTEPPLVVHIEGSAKVGISTVMEELSLIQPPGCQVHYMHAIERHPLQTVIGEINWTAWRESHNGMGACLVELTNYIMQRYKIQIPLGTQMVVMNRSLGSLHKVFNSTKSVMIHRELEDAIALNALFEAFNNLLERPHMVIYIQTDQTTQENRISQSRRFPIETETLKDIGQLYEDYLKTMDPKVHILRLSTSTESVERTVTRAYMGIQELFLMDKLSEYVYIFPHLSDNILLYHNGIYFKTHGP